MKIETTGSKSMTSIDSFVSVPDAEVPLIFLLHFE
jgi:hypothetical protein